MRVTAKLNNLRVAPRKSAIVVNLIKGMDANEALVQLDAHVKKTGPYLKKLLLSAIANGENNLGLDKDNLYVLDARIGAGASFKRWMPKAFGRAGKILKRTSNISIVLEERIEGKGRRTKEEMEKERKIRMEKNKKEEKERMKEAEKRKADAKVAGDKIGEGNIEEDHVKKDGAKKGWARKMFRRKSM